MQKSLGAMLLLVTALVLGGTPVLAADAPVLLASNPADGSVGIPPGLAGILLVFDRAMDPGSHSFVLSEQGDFPPLNGDAEWFNERTMFLPLKDLTPGKTYGVGLNSDRHQGFKSTAGAPLAPTSIHFTVTAGFPVVLGTKPNTGETEVDASVDHIVIYFSEDVKAGRMSLIRLAGTQPLGYIPGKQPFFHDAKTLVVPVKLAANTTYGVGVNGPGRFGFVSAGSGKPVQPFQLVFTTGEGKAEPVTGGLVGHWKYTTGDGEIQVKLNADGTYLYYLRGPDGEERTEGTWKAADGKLTILEKGESKPLVVEYRQESANRLNVNMGGDWIPFDRVGGDRPPPPPSSGKTSIIGSWYWSHDNEWVAMTFFKDGRYTYRGSSNDGTEAAKGGWTLEGSRLIVSQDGGAQPLRVPFRFLDADTLEVEIEGRRYPLKKQDEGEDVPEENRLRGSLLYTRYEVRKLPAGSPVPEIILPKMYCSYFGRFKTNAIWGEDDEDHYTTVQDPWWSPDGQTILCASDYSNWMSALYMDVWMRDRQKSEFGRVTGNSKAPAKTGKTGSIRFKVSAYPGKTPKRTTYGWQGMEGEGKELDKEGTGIIEKVPAGKIWVKFFLSKHEGDMKVVDVPPGGEVSASFSMDKGNYLATYPSITPDGKYIICLSQHAYLEGPGVKAVAKGIDTLAAIRVEDGQLVALWDIAKNGGNFAKDARLSPDGKWIVFAMGMPGMENLAVMSLESFLKGKPEPRVLVPGDRVLGHGTWGNVSPAWSPDGRQIVFSRYFMTTSIKGNLCVVPFEGGAYRQLTNLGPNQCPTYPSWSPYNEGIAFQLITSKGPVLDILDIPKLNITSDVCVIGVDGKNPRRLTTDGRSGQPAWGRYPE